MDKFNAWQVASPQTENDWAAYYDLRWRILRAPWSQPKGSEHADDDATSFHAMIRIEEKVIACGRIHFKNEHTAQVRFMAVDSAFQGLGLGGKVLQFLEEHALKNKMQKIILQAREEAIPFYQRNGYSVIEKTELLFGSIQHYLMEKTLN